MPSRSNISGEPLALKVQSLMKIIKPVVDIYLLMLNFKHSKQEVEEERHWRNLRGPRSRKDSPPWPVLKGLLRGHPTTQLA